MIYADYEYYANEYLGCLIDAAAFDRCAMRASHYIDTITYNRAKDHADLEAVKMATCAVAEQYYIVEKAELSAASGDGEISSQTVGGYSVSYRNSAERTAAAQQKMHDVAREYLLNTGLLYRGCGRCTDHTL